VQLEAPELAFQRPAKLERIDYYKHLRNAKFCLAPRGESSWTLRFYEAFFVVQFQSYKFHFVKNRRFEPGDVSVTVVIFLLEVIDLYTR